MDKTGKIGFKIRLRVFGFFLIAIGAIIAGVFSQIAIGTIFIGVGTAITGVSELIWLKQLMLFQQFLWPLEYLHLQ